MDVYKVPIALPYWPKEIERQFQRWIGQEPWWSQLDELRYLHCPAWGDEPRPGVPAGSWGRFFVWRWQTGYGTKDFAFSVMGGAVDTEVRLGEVQRGLRQGVLCVEDLERLMAWAIAPLYAAVQASAWGPRELFHRNTVRRLARMRLLDDGPAVGRP